MLVQGNGQADTHNKTLGRVPKETLKFNMDYYGFTKTHLNFNAQYTGDRWDRNGEPVNGSKTGKYTVLNAVINYDIQKNYTIYLKIDNLGNKYYQLVDGYATAERSFYAGIKANF